MLSAAGRYATRHLTASITLSRAFASTSVTRDAATDRTDKDESKKIAAKSPIAGLLAKQAALERSIQRRISALAGQATKLRRQQERQNAAAEPPVPRAAPSALQPHHDLETFLDYAEMYNLKTTTTVFKGTLYEYTVAEALKAYGMSLSRVGKSNDHGVDLLGHWTLPQPPRLRMLLQCKMTKPMPSMIRELEGSYVGAPPGWQSYDVLALLASRHAASPGTQQAIQRSRWPVGFVQVDVDGVVKQFIWNSVATEAGLEGVGVTSRFSAASENVEASIALTWMGESWRTTEQSSG